MIEGVDYFVRVTDFPKGAVSHGMVLLNDDGTYSVYIDKNATDEQQAASLQHELDHIAGDDLYGDKKISSVEKNLDDEPEKRDYMSSWQDWMQWCAREMQKKGITPFVM